MGTSSEDWILAITRDDDYPVNPSKQEQVHAYERQIDQMVYNLYGLTKDEIDIIAWHWDSPYYYNLFTLIMLRQ